jgi:CMP-N,N'-diacetyllegionaminic acid synthase
VNGPARVAALVPARAGSKGIPGKNLVEIGGRSLLQWAIDLAKATRSIDRCIVSTDGADIAREAARLGAEVHPRPSRLARDDALVIDTILHVREWHKMVGEACEQFVLLQPTSPFRSPPLVEQCLRALLEGFDSTATFAPATLHPHRAFRLEGPEPYPYIRGAVPWLPRQQLNPPAYELTGAVYAFWIERLTTGSPSLLFGNPAAVRTDGPIVDIDTPFDAHLANTLLESGVVYNFLAPA